MRTFKQIQDDVWTQLREEVGDTGFWSEQEVKDAINDSYVAIANETHCFRLEAIIEVIAGIRIYKLPENYIMGSLYRVEFDKEKILPVTSEELDAWSTTWRNDESSDTFWYVPPGDISLTDEIVLYPKPDTSGDSYNLASESEDQGVIVKVGDDTYEEFTEEEGVITATDGESKFKGSPETGPVVEIENPDNNIRIFGAKYPKRLYQDDEVFLHPVSHNPKRTLVLGPLAVLFAKEGEGKDIQKASYYNKRFMETLTLFEKPNVKRFHRMKSISESSIGESSFRGLNLGDHYPSYYRR